MKLFHNSLKTKNFATGRWTEALAAEYLVKLGYKIIECNHRTRWAEIDIVANDRGCLVFVEVRSRSSEDYGRPEESINHAKITRLIRNAESYAAHQRWPGSCRIDAVCIVFNSRRQAQRISHYKNITF
jgi:putative endonuclease